MLNCKCLAFSFSLSDESGVGEGGGGSVGLIQTTDFGTTTTGM